MSYNSTLLKYEYKSRCRVSCLPYAIENHYENFPLFLQMIHLASSHLFQWKILTASHHENHCHPLISCCDDGDDDHDPKHWFLQSVPQHTLLSFLPEETIQFPLQQQRYNLRIQLKCKKTACRMIINTNPGLQFLQKDLLKSAHVNAHVHCDHDDHGLHGRHVSGSALHLQ